MRTIKEEIILKLFQLKSHEDDFSNIEPLLKEAISKKINVSDLKSPFGDSLLNICQFNQLRKILQGMESFCRPYGVVFPQNHNKFLDEVKSNFEEKSELCSLLKSAGNYNLELLQLIGKDFNCGDFSFDNENEYIHWILKKIPHATENQKEKIKVFRNHLLRMIQLIEEDPRILVKETPGKRIPLMIACFMGFTWAVKRFLQVASNRNEQLSKKDVQNIGALHFAAFDFRETNQEILKILISYYPYNEYSCFNTTPSSIARQYGYYEIANFIDDNSIYTSSPYTLLSQFKKPQKSRSVVAPGYQLEKHRRMHSI
jgi:hypothetical protein